MNKLTCAAKTPNYNMQKKYVNQFIVADNNILFRNNINLRKNYAQLFKRPAWDFEMWIIHLLHLSLDNFPWLTVSQYGRLQKSRPNIFWSKNSTKFNVNLD